MRGEEVVRSVPRGAVLPDRDQVCAVPGRVLLRGRQPCAEAVPGQLLLPAGVVVDDRVPGRQEIGARGEISPRLRLNFLRRGPGGGGGRAEAAGRTAAAAVTTAASKTAIPPASPP